MMYLCLLFISIDVFDYFYYYITSNNRKYDKWGGFTNYYEYNPILKNFIHQPSNTITNFAYYLPIFLYENTSLNLIHKLSVICIANGSFFMHGSNTNYGKYLDISGMIFYFILYNVKDLYIFGFVTNTYILNICVIFYYILRVLISKKVLENEEIKLLENIDFLKFIINFKIINEIKKLRILNYNLSIFIWIILSTLIELKDEPFKIKEFKRRTCNILFKNYISFHSFIHVPWITGLVYSILINFIKVNEQVNPSYFFIGIFFLMIAFIFQEKEFFNYTCREKTNICQYHSLWHILSAIGLFFIDYYLYINII